MKPRERIERVEGQINYRFRNRNLIEAALTHASKSSQAERNNERLEFLGDRVLNLVIAESLLKQDQSAPVGILAPRFNRLVGQDTCAAVANDVDVGSVALLGRSESRSGGRKRLSLLADMIEAIIGAVYLDSGFENARDLVVRLWSQKISAVEKDAKDAKSTLQELVQSSGAPLPVYEEIARTGPDHKPEYVVEVSLHTGETARGRALSKRAAEKKAAKALLGRLGESTD